MTGLRPILPLACALALAASPALAMSVDEQLCRGMLPTSMSSSDDYATRPEPRQQVAACDRVLAARPADRDLMIARAQGLSRGKRHDEAVAQAERAMSDQYGRTNLLQWLQYQDILVEAGNWTKLLSVADHVLGRFPQRKDVSLYRGLALARLGRDRDAGVALRAWRQAEPGGGSSPAARMAARELDRIQEAEGGAPQSPEARRQLCQGAGVDPAKREQACNALLDDTREPRSRAHLLRYRALARQQAGRHDEGIADLREVVRLVPDEPMAVYELAGYLIGVGRPQDALEVADAGRARLPGNVHVLHIRSAALTQLRRYDEAEATLDEIETIAPELKADLDAARDTIRKHRAGG